MQLPGPPQEASENTQSFHFLSSRISGVSPQTRIQDDKQTQSRRLSRIQWLKS